MSDETLLVIVVLAGMAAMVAVLIWYGRHAEKRLTASSVIEIPIDSTLRGVIVALPAAIVMPVLVPVLAPYVDPHRQHGVAAVLLAVGGGGLMIVLAILATRRFRRIGTLRCTLDQLELQLRAFRCSIDLHQPFTLEESDAFGPGNAPVQVLEIRQRSQACAFSYMLPIKRKPYGGRHVEGYITPLLGGTARVIHDRLRALAGAAPSA